jgi:DUF971 family protein
MMILRLRLPSRITAAFYRALGQSAEAQGQSAEDPGQSAEVQGQWAEESPPDVVFH